MVVYIVTLNFCCNTCRPSTGTTEAVVDLNNPDGILSDDESDEFHWETMPAGDSTFTAVNPMLNPDRTAAATSTPASDGLAGGFPSLNSADVSALFENARPVLDLWPTWNNPWATQQPVASELERSAHQGSERPN